MTTLEFIGAMALGAVAVLAILFVGLVLFVRGFYAKLPSPAPQPDVAPPPTCTDGCKPCTEAHPGQPD